MLARGCFDDTKVITKNFHIFVPLFFICYLYRLIITSLTDQGAVLVKNLAAAEPSALGLDTYYKQYYLCLAAAAAAIKW